MRPWSSSKAHMGGTWRMCNWVRVTAIVSDANACRGLDCEDTPLQCGLCAGILVIVACWGSAFVAYLNEVLGHRAHTQGCSWHCGCLHHQAIKQSNHWLAALTHCSYCLWASCIVYEFAWIACAGDCQCFAYVNPRPPRCCYVQ
jgi:hypothetical protein